MKLRSALALATHLGMPWRRALPQDLWPNTEGSEQRWSWDGRALVVTAWRAGTDVLHEVCHWLTATKRMRTQREFGLGAAPFRYVVNEDLRDFSNVSVQYEVDTCVLELLLRERVCSRAVTLRRARNIGIEVKRGLPLREGMPLSGDPTPIPQGEWFEPKTIVRLAAVLRAA